MDIKLDKVQGAKKEAFFDGLFEELKKYPFGSMTKRDTECFRWKTL
jgi:hypothetical protein